MVNSRSHCSGRDIAEPLIRWATRRTSGGGAQPRVIEPQLHRRAVLAGSTQAQDGGHALAVAPQSSRGPAHRAHRPGTGTCAAGPAVMAFGGVLPAWDRSCALFSQTGGRLPLCLERPRGRASEGAHSHEGLLPGGERSFGDWPDRRSPAAWRGIGVMKPPNGPSGLVAVPLAGASRWCCISRRPSSLTPATSPSRQVIWPLGLEFAAKPFQWPWEIQQLWRQPWQAKEAWSRSSDRR